MKTVLLAIEHFVLPFSFSPFLCVSVCNQYRRNLGRLLLSIATTTQITSTTNATTLQLCEAVLVQRFSSDVCTLVRALLYSGTNPSTTSSSLGTSTTAYGIPPHPQLLTLQSLCSMISHRVWDELDRAHTVADAYSEELSKCYDNTRALRLLIKLGWINERPEFGMDTQWSETGDRYVSRWMQLLFFMFRPISSVSFGPSHLKM